MPTILAEIGIQGQVEHLVLLMRAEPWREFWDDLQMRFVTLSDVGLNREALDSTIWHLCQEQQFVLVTGNRNADGPDSLQATIVAHNTPKSLPVLTVGDAQELQHSRDYANAVIEDLLDVMMRLEELRGTGRLYLPLK